VKRALFVLLAACGSGDKIEKLPAPSPPAEDPTPPPAVTCEKALAAPVDPREPAVPTTLVAAPARVRPPRVVIATPTVTGDLDTQIVAQNLRRHQLKFQLCFDVELLAKPQLPGGIVETAFAIQPSGKVASPTADGIDPALATCFSKALENVSFPAPVDGNQVQVSVRIVVSHTPPSGTTPVVTKRAPREWTPFAASTQPSDAAPVEATAAGVRGRISAIDTCFDGARGAVRAMIAFDARGKVAAIRTGGIGDSAMELCIGRELAGITVPAGPAVEIACDITRGGHAPLRVSPDAGYTVIELTRTEARHRSSVRALPPRGEARSVTAIGAASSVLVVAEPDAPGHGLEYALWWAPEGTTLVAVKASGGAPVFLGMGDSRARRLANSTKRTVQLRTDAGKMRACIAGEQLDASAPLLDPKAMDDVMAAVAQACQRAACDPTVIVGTSGEFIVKDLVATTSAARRAGFATISIGGPACD
jgi:hypothetical protein